MIVPPYCSRHSQTRSTNASRPSSSRVVPSLSELLLDLACVAMPAWSVPRIHLRVAPRMRAQRMSVSWIEPLSAWPMCSAPVTFGGGTAIE